MLLVERAKYKKPPSDIGRESLIATIRRYDNLRAKYNKQKRTNGHFFLPRDPMIGYMRLITFSPNTCAQGCRIYGE